MTSTTSPIDSTLELDVEVICWDDQSLRLRLLDQTRLPKDIVSLNCETVEDVWQAIVKLGVRGAPAIGIAAAYGVCLAARGDDSASLPVLKKRVYEAIEYLASSRPTAVNLFWALDRMRRTCDQFAGDANGLQGSLIAEAKTIHQQDRDLCQSIAQYGAKRLQGAKRFLTHCNAGKLATGGLGTALAPLYELQRMGIAIEVYADETRPLLQGSRLTAWELSRAGIAVTMITDSMAGGVLRDGKVDAVIVGADRITARGDFANKIGTYSLAVLAKHHHIPFFVAAPHSTFDLTLIAGDEIPIELRRSKEVADIAGWNLGSATPNVFNPAFDVTPAELVTAYITDLGVIETPNEVLIRERLASVT